MGLTSVGTDLIAGDPTGNIVNGLTYRGSGGVKQMSYGNGQRLDASYGLERQQPARLVVIKPGDIVPVIDFSYDYENGGKNNGRVQKITDGRDTRFTTTYSYDDYQRLQEASAETIYQRQYEYDPWGNLLSVTASGLGLPSYDLSHDQDVNGVPYTNRISNAGYDYDQSGNLTTDGELTYGYDAAGRLTTASMLDSAYNYDGDGRRIRQSNSTGVVHYLWSSLLGEPVVELDEGGGVYRAYVYGPGGGLLGLQAYDFQFYWVHQDHLGSTRRLTDGSGVEVYRGEFDPHGQVLEEDPANDYRNSRKFTGYERDWTTDLDNAKARMYASKTGRFMQPDPLGVAAADATNPQSLNRYGYVGNDPVNFVDPNGLMLVCFYHYQHRDYLRADGTIVQEVNLIFDGCVEYGGSAPLYPIGVSGDDGQGVETPSRQKLLSPCFTAKSLLRWDDLQVAMNRAWDKAKKENQEFGGWVVWDKNKKEAYAYLSSWKGVTLKTPSGSELYKIWEEGYAWRLYAGNNPNLVRIIDFHTHLSGTKRSNLDAQSLETGGRPFGIIVQGINTYSIYNSDISKDEADAASLNNCLPIGNN